MSGAAAASVLDRGADVFDPADAEHPLVVDMDAAVMAQVIVEPPVTLSPKCYRPLLFYN